MGRKKGFKHSEETKKKIGIANAREKILYPALHKWLRERKPKPELCEFCKERDAIHLAKITKYYTRDINNYRYLCAKCHSKWDRIHPTGQKVPTTRNGIKNKIRVFESEEKEIINEPINKWKHPFQEEQSK